MVIFQVLMFDMYLFYTIAFSICLPLKIACGDVDFVRRSFFVAIIDSCQKLHKTKLNTRSAVRVTRDERGWESKSPPAKKLMGTSTTRDESHTEFVRVGGGDRRPGTRGAAAN